MFKIIRIHDNSTPFNKGIIRQIQAILQKQFPLLAQREIDGIADGLHDPFKKRFRIVIFAGLASRDSVAGFAVMYHAPDLNFCYLDFLSAAFGRTGRGIGGILYELVRAEAQLLGVHGLYFECLPDDPRLSPDMTVRRQNAARLRFYERYGARPVWNTAYQTPVKQGDTDPPYLVFDDLGSAKTPSRTTARAVVRAILKRKYGYMCPQDYITMVVHSIQDDPVQLRPLKYVDATKPDPSVSVIQPDNKIALIVSSRHEIHHVHSRGYVEAPVRINSILSKIEPTGLFARAPLKVFPEKYITNVHNADYVKYFKQLCHMMKNPDEAIYPYVFPVRNAAKKPRILSVRAGYYCIDTFTPLTGNAFVAAKRAVDTALTGAELLLANQRIVYSLVRPPGHHAEKSVFGGFCYFNSASIAAEYLSAFGRVAILDIDYHHGNGHQDIFYLRRDVLTISIHGHPNVTYPYFSGFPSERGKDTGFGYNMNIALPEGINGIRYSDALETAIKTVRSFRPSFLVVAFGLDTARNDPTGSWLLTGNDFEKNGFYIGAQKLKTLVVQEGGYDNRTIGNNAARFFTGLWKGCYGAVQ